MFGDKWTIKHGESPTGEWGNVLMTFDEKQILAGVRRMTEDAEKKIRIGDDAWPPTVFEFACYCKTSPSQYFPENTAYRLPPLRADKETAKAALKNIRKVLT